MMKERTLRVLEFTKIREQLSSYAVTDMGRALCSTNSEVLQFFLFYCFSCRVWLFI